LGIIQTDMIGFTVNARYTKELIFIGLPLTLVSIAGISAFFYLRKTRKQKTNRIPHESLFDEQSFCHYCIAVNA